MCMAYMIQALDKGVIGPASIMGWLPDIGAQGQDYSLTSTILWIGIIAGEPLVRHLHSSPGIVGIVSGFNTTGQSAYREVEASKDLGYRDVHLECGEWLVLR